MDRDYWIKKWKDDKVFVIENDRLKKRSYLYTPFPKTNMYGFQGGNIRGLIACDILARYQRMQNKNVLFPTGNHSLCNTSFIENKKYSNLLNDDISNMYNDQMLKLGIGINDNKHIDMRHNEYLANLQQAFIDLYQRGYIEYKEAKVYYDKKHNKIYDEMFHFKNMVTVFHKCFVLKIKNILPELLNNIENIECDQEIKNKLILSLSPKQMMHLEFGVSNGASLNIQMDEPQYMGGISFIFLNPDYIDITDYVDINEYHSVFSYLEGENSDILFAFSGLYARNPLTGMEIPIFISTMFHQDIYLGVPDIDEEDGLLAKEEGLEILHIVDHGTLMNSDFLDGLEIEEAKKRIFDVFSEAELAEVETIYCNEEIVLSSLDNFGPLFPFLEDKDTGEIYSLSGHLPYAFSSKLRPVLVDNVDIIGTTMNGTINNLFTEGMCPIISMLYDQIGSLIPIFSDDAVKEYQNWNAIDYMLVDTENLFSTVLMPCIFYTMIQKELNMKQASLIKKLSVYAKTVDFSGNDIKRANNNLIDLEALMDKYSSDAIRIFSMLSDFKEPFIFDYYGLEDISVDIHKLQEALTNFSEENSHVDFALFNLIKQTTDALDEENFYQYANEIKEFIHNYIFEYGLSKKQTYIFIRLIYPIFPFLAEEIFKNSFNGKYSIMNEDWPN